MTKAAVAELKQFESGAKSQKVALNLKKCRNPMTTEIRILVFYSLGATLVFGMAGMSYL